MAYFLALAVRQSALPFVSDICVLPIVYEFDSPFALHVLPLGVSLLFLIFLSEVLYSSQAGILLR